jgi:hypothetical protein
VSVPGARELVELEERVRLPHATPRWDEAEFAGPCGQGGRHSPAERDDAGANPAAASSWMRRSRGQRSGAAALSRWRKPVRLRPGPPRRRAHGRGLSKCGHCAWLKTRRTEFDSQGPRQQLRNGDGMSVAGGQAWWSGSSHKAVRSPLPGRFDSVARYQELQGSRLVQRQDASSTRWQRRSDSSSGYQQRRRTVRLTERIVELL